MMRVGPIKNSTPPPVPPLLTPPTGIINRDHDYVSDGFWNPITSHHHFRRCLLLNDGRRMNGGDEMCGGDIWCFQDDEPEEKEKKQKTKSNGFVTPLPISEALMQFFGTGEIELSRSEVVKRIWDYIKKNDLQDPSDKRRILCDDKLRELFKADAFVGFTVTKLLSPHFIKQQQ